MDDRHLDTSLDFAYKISLNWYKPGNANDVTEVDGASLGRAFRISAFESLYPHLNRTTRRPGWRGVLKRLNLQWQVRLASTLFPRVERTESSDVLLVFDTNNRPMIAILNSIGMELQRVGVPVMAVCVDSHIRNQVRLSNKILWGAFFKPSHYWAATRDARRIRGSLKKLPYVNPVVGEPLTARAAATVTKSFRAQLAQLARETKALGELLNVTKPRLILTASDQHRVSSQIVDLARKRGIPSAVVQHGALSPLFIPMQADYYLVWGEAWKKWLAQNGESVENVVVVGEPRGALEAEAMDGSGRLIIFVNPLSQFLTAQFLPELLRAAARWTGELIIKIHPSDNDFRFYERFLQTAGLNNAKLDNRPLNRLQIGKTDLCVVTGNSTVGLELVQQGCRLINVRHPGIIHSIDFASVGIQCTPASFAAALASPPKLPTLMAKQLFVQEYLGDAVGPFKSADWISRFLRMGAPQADPQKTQGPQDADALH